MSRINVIMRNDNEIQDQVLQPFTFLRGPGDVRVSGVLDDYARFIEGRMKSHEPAENIWKMRDSFLDLCVRWTGDIECDVAHDTMMAFEYCDVWVIQEGKRTCSGRAGSVPPPKHAANIRVRLARWLSMLNFEKAKCVT